jgi:hypothetical protein
VDCDGDGRVVASPNKLKDEPRAGQPLVCPSVSVGPAPMVLSLLRSLPTEGLVSTTVDDPAGFAAGGVGIDRLDLAAPHALHRDLLLTCAPGAGGTAPVTVQGRVDSGPISRAVITVECGALPVIPRQVVPPVVPPLLPNPGVPPVPANPPAAQAQAQVQAQSQVQGQVAAGVVEQEQQQIQLASEVAGLLPPDEDSVSQLAMSRRDEQERVARALLAAALLASTVVGAVGYRRRFATVSAVRAARVGG